MTIEHREKIGLGVWERNREGGTLNDVDGAGFAWHYTWSEWALWDADATPERSSFVAMAWGERDMTADALGLVKASGATTLLGFNEPDHPTQASMTVGRALDLWPQLQATGLRLGSPAVTPTGALGADGWLGRFMAGAAERALKVDFVAVHYYSDTKDVGAFKAFLQAVHDQHGKPVWVTEWALADWSNPGRFSAAEQADFARAGVEMMDDLSFVEKHAWFASYEGGDGWHLGSGVFDGAGNLTAVGRVFAELNAPAGEVVGTAGADDLVGGDRPDVLRGLGGADRLRGEGGNDVLVGGAGDDVLDGGAGADRMEGGTGNDTFVVDAAGDMAVESAGEGTDHVLSSASIVLAGQVEHLTLTGAENVAGTGNNLANRITGNAGANVLKGSYGKDALSGGAGDDRLDGGAHADTLSGGAGADVLLGGAWDDRLDGGDGADTLAGGDGADRFVFASGQDRIADFADDVDTLLLDDALWGGAGRTVGEVLDLAVVLNGAAVFDFGDGHTLRVEGVGVQALADDLALV